ncbi:MAG: phospho-N-acetylmuramoyl-pentapeptide-transferase [bacterium]
MPVILDKLLMVKLLLVVLGSLSFTAFLTVPFINLLYKLKFKNPKAISEDMYGKKTIFNKLHGQKVGTPTGGGILIIGSAFLFSIVFYSLTRFAFNWTAAVLFLTMFLFGVLGFYDDYKKFFGKGKDKGVFWGLRFKHKLIIQIIFAAIIVFFLNQKMGLSAVRLPLMGSVDFGWWYIPFAVSVIVGTCNAFNITDGLDGLSSGLLLIALAPFLYLTSFSNYGGDVGLFIAVIVGPLLTFLYFNIYPARLFMGDTGALALGAMLGVIALLTNQAVALIFIGAVFVVEACSTLIQWASIILVHKGKLEKKVFKIAPLHHHFEALGWPETKVTMRFWLAGAFFATLGLLVALL